MISNFIFWSITGMIVIIFYFYIKKTTKIIRFRCNKMKKEGIFYVA